MRDSRIWHEKFFPDWVPYNTLVSLLFPLPLLDNFSFKRLPSNRSLIGKWKWSQISVNNTNIVVLRPTILNPTYSESGWWITSRNNKLEDKQEQSLKSRCNLIKNVK